MRAIIDLDSAIYASCFNVETLGEAKEKLEEKLDSILSHLSDFCEVNEVWICNGSRGNFRKDINKSYKANRTQELPTFLGELHDWVKTTFKSYWTNGFETDDVVATLWKESVAELGLDNVVIVSPDKDFKQFPCLFFDSYWKRMELSKIDDFESKYNFYTQMIVGDSADNVNYIKGKGKRYTNKLFSDAKTEFSLLRRTYKEYIDVYGDDAKDKFNECKKLLNLRIDVKNIKQSV